ncbi:MAG: hypothetical protein CBC48_02455 [bacterium TMED88]|nr:hypothetical protein [Deltaproteobacteria bacterium]OUV36267.1 MAG: hypothetical protein CBC48_02455 [bacterium TMED88]
MGERAFRLNCEGESGRDRFSESSHRASVRSRKIRAAQPMADRQVARLAPAVLELRRDPMR